MLFLTFVSLGDMVQKGQKIAVQKNVFGDILKTYVAPESGKVLSVGDDPLREPRGLLVRILFNNPSIK